MKWVLTGLALSFVPIWRDDMDPDRGINLWEYITMATTLRRHLPVEEAIDNYQRNTL